jgi:glutaredoxin 2
MLKNSSVKKNEEVERIIDSNEFDIFGFIDEFYNKSFIKNILDENEVEDFVKYAIGKKNAKFTPFETNFESILKYFQ